MGRESRGLQGRQGAGSALSLYPAFSEKTPVFSLDCCVFLAMLPFPAGIAGNLILQKLTLKKN